ncbi:MAG TPA: hypothetical protein VJ894_06615 [Cryomorphaceae bacterium]|nr:hypothetical protein [Cryomorphaceae bacterium]
MALEAIKLEIIEWLTRLDDKSTIEYLKVIKESMGTKKDWWTDLSEAQKQSIAKGLDDADTGRLTSHEEVKNKYGL